MRAAFCVLAWFLMAGCDVPPLLKPSLYRFMTPERVEVRSPSCPVSIHL